jgi:hypothetical protein
MLKIDVSQNASTLKVSIDDADAATVEMTAADVDALIRSLTVSRARMVPPTAHGTLPKGTVVLDEAADRWWLGLHHDKGQVSVAFDHPLFGRMSIPFKPDVTREVMKTMGHVQDLLAPYTAASGRLN